MNHNLFIFMCAVSAQTQLVSGTSAAQHPPDQCKRLSIGVGVTRSTEDGLSHVHHLRDKRKKKDFIGLRRYILSSAGHK